MPWSFILQRITARGMWSYLPWIFGQVQGKWASDKNDVLQWKNNRNRVWIKARWDNGQSDHKQWILYGFCTLQCAQQLYIALHWLVKCVLWYKSVHCNVYDRCTQWYIWITWVGWSDQKQGILSIVTYNWFSTMYFNKYKTTQYVLPAEIHNKNCTRVGWCDHKQCTLWR